MHLKEIHLDRFIGLLGLLLLYRKWGDLIMRDMTYTYIIECYCDQLDETFYVGFIAMNEDEAIKMFKRSRYGKFEIIGIDMDD